VSAPKTTDTFAAISEAPTAGDSATPWRAPAPPTLEDAPNVFALVKRAVRNPLQSIPAEVYKGQTEVRNLVGRRLFFVSSPELFDEILKKRADEFLKGGVAREIYNRAIRQAISNAEGDHWKRQRKMIAPIFRPKLLNQFVDRLFENSVEFSSRLASGSESADFRMVARAMTLGNVVACLFRGLDESSVARIPHLVVDLEAGVPWMRILSILGVGLGAPFPQRARTFGAMAEMRRITHNYAQARRASRSDAIERDLTDALLGATDPDGGPALSNDEVSDNLVNLILGGFETTSSLITYALYSLTQNLEVMRDVVAEVDQVFGRDGYDFVAIDRLDLLDRALMETLRLFPPFPALWRQARRGTTLDGLEVKPRDYIQLSIFALQRNAQVWPDPLVFDPQRFRQQAVESRHPFAFAAFGGGQRRCLGDRFAMLNAKVSIATLLSIAEVACPESAPLHLVDKHVLIPNSPIQMTFTARKR
jgi:cytochrome P450